MKTTDIAVVEGRNLEEVARALNEAVQAGRRVRLTVEGGLKIAVGGEAWTLPYGRVGNETGQ